MKGDFCSGNRSAQTKDENLLTNDGALRSCANSTFSRSIFPVKHLFFLWKQGLCSNLIVIVFSQLSKLGKKLLMMSQTPVVQNAGSCLSGANHLTLSNHE